MLHVDRTKKSWRGWYQYFTWQFPGAPLRRPSKACSNPPLVPDGEPDGEMCCNFWMVQILCLKQAAHSPSPVPPRRWDGVGRDTHGEHLLGPVQLPVKQAPAEWDARGRLFFLSLFFQASVWHAVFSLIPEIPMLSFSPEWTEESEGSCCCNLQQPTPRNSARYLVTLCFVLPGAVSQRWLTRCRASFILEIFVLSMQRAQQMDLLALWGKNGCSVVLKTSLRRTSRTQLVVLSLTPGNTR